MQSFIHATAEVADGARIGTDCKLWHQSQVMATAELGNGCTVGKGAFIGAGARVGNLVKVGNYANVMGALVEDEAFIGPQAYLMEDAAPRATNPDGTRRGPGDWNPQPVTVRRGGTVGGGALVLPGVTVGAWAMVAAGAVVHRDVSDHALVAGNPARQVGWVCRCGQRLDDELRCPCGRQWEEVDEGLRERSTR